MELEAIVSSLWVVTLSLWAVITSVWAAVVALFWGVSTWVGAALVVLIVAVVLWGGYIEVAFKRNRSGSGEDILEITDDDPQLKCTPEYFEGIWDESKPFEVRRNDRDFEVGDIYFLREYEPVFKRYTGRWVEVEFTYILELDYFFVSQAIHSVAEAVNGYVVIGIKELSRHDGRVIEEEPEIPDSDKMRLA